MKRIAVLTSGGDAPGMNAAIRAVVRTGLDRGWEVFGVRHGYAGLISGVMESLTARDVGGILQRGGTMLGSARSQEFQTEAGRRTAIRHLRERDVEALVVIGGNGSQTGAHHLFQMGFPVVGVASTIDNDLSGSDITIGVDTALNIALEAIDRLKTTASSHQRAFLVEVMGRDCGYLALMAGIAGGAEAVVIPEFEADPDAVAAELRTAYERGSRTPWSWWPRGRSTTPRQWPPTSESTGRNSASTCGPRPWAMSSGAAHLGHSTGSWQPGWGQARPRRSPGVNRGCWSASSRAR